MYKCIRSKPVRAFSSQIQSMVGKESSFLRVLDFIDPKKAAPTKRQNHTRLVQDVLRTEDGAGDQKLGNGDFSWDAVALSRALTSCASSGSLSCGTQLHGVAVVNGFLSNVYVGSSLISLYSRLGELRNGCKVFDEMPVRNVVTWTAVISGFAQEWQVDMCLELYNGMRVFGLRPNDITVTSVLSACTGGGSLGQGRSAHCQTVRLGFESWVHIANALVSMYCKSGSFKEALCVFEGMHGKDIFSWNSMIAGYALHGLAFEAVGLFEMMKKQEVRPDAFTYLSILSSCRHAGLVEQGRSYFNTMFENNVDPHLDHYACIVDLFGRAGLMEEASQFIENMPIAPNAVIWGSLLSSCRLHGCLHLGIQAAENRLLLEPSCAGTHIQIANLYADLGYGSQAARVRKLMKDKGLKTNPGYSWIEIEKKVHRFTVEDTSNTRVIEVVSVIDSLVEHMTGLYCEPDI